MSSGAISVRCWLNPAKLHQPFSYFLLSSNSSLLRTLRTLDTNYLHVPIGYNHNWDRIIQRKVAILSSLRLTTNHCSAKVIYAHKRHLTGLRCILFNDQFICYIAAFMCTGEHTMLILHTPVNTYSCTIHHEGKIQYVIIAHQGC
jgi:hypothetical protein